MVCAELFRTPNYPQGLLKEQSLPVPGMESRPSFKFKMRLLSEIKKQKLCFTEVPYMVN